MAQDFLSASDAESNHPVFADSVEAEREQIKHVLYGSKRSIALTIHDLHNRGYAEAQDWSRPQPTQIPGEFVSILLKYLLLK